MDTIAPSNAIVSNNTAPKTPTATIQSQQHGPSDGSHSAKNEVVAPNIPYDLSENKATMASYAELRPKAFFPPELLRMITKHFGERKSQADLADLWMNARNVCKIFKEEVEEIFRKEHLQKTWLHLGNGQNERGVEFSTRHYIRADEQQFAHEIHPNNSKHEHRQARELRFDFDRFDLDNGGVTVFTPDKKQIFLAFKY